MGESYDYCGEFSYDPTNAILKKCPSSKFKGGGGGGFEPPPPKKINKKTTAAPVEQLSEAAKKNRRASANLLMRAFTEPRLSQAGLLGIPE